MDWRTLAGGSAVVGIVLAVAGVVVTLAGTNPLLSSSDLRTPALAVFAVVAASLVGFVLLGGPSGRWRSTPYW